MRMSRRCRRHDLDPKRIDVLPFVNMSADAENEYFADDITEELITELSRIGELSVIARTSVMKFKGTEQSIAEIGRELNVGTVLEGSVRKAGDQVRISAQLIDVASEAHLWADDYDRGLEAIFAIQSDVAEQVAEALKIALTKQVQQSIQTPGTTNVDAYQLYLEALDANARGDVPNSASLRCREGRRNVRRAHKRSHPRGRRADVPPVPPGAGTPCARMMRPARPRRRVKSAAPTCGEGLAAGGGRQGPANLPAEKPSHRHDGPERARPHARPRERRARRRPG
jgi:TolB-like protein